MASRAVSIGFAFTLLAGCGSAPQTLSQADAACARGAPYVEVLGTGRVVRVLGERESRSGLHEGFLFALSGRVVRVEDNVDITGPVPLHAGDRIELQGQYECDDGVIHWTHHDPSGRHPAGFLIVHGTTYQ